MRERDRQKPVWRWAGRPAFTKKWGFYLLNDWEHEKIVSDVVTRGWLLALRATKMFILMTPRWGIYPKKINQKIKRGMYTKTFITLFTIIKTGRNPQKNT